MDVDQQIERIRADGEALARAADAGPLDASVPGCPDWDVELLVRHVGDVHRWAATIVRERLTRTPPARLRRPPAAATSCWPGTARAATRCLTRSRRRSPEDAFWFWGPAPNALAFWARRQANETAVHRCDAEAARGAVTPLTTVDALDALDEWFGLAVRRARAPDGGGRILRIVATDANATWNLIIGDRVEVTSDRGRGHCELRGTGSDLYLWSMNRRGTDGISVSGDDSLVRVWADNVRF